MYESQKDLVLNHLKTYGRITSWEAIEKYHITRLSEYIRSLRNDDGINIPDEWKENNGKRFKEYRLGAVELKQEVSGQLIFV